MAVWTGRLSMGQLELIGASGVILEDQQRPRRCGHVDGKRLLPLEDYLTKLDMVLRTGYARSGP